MVADGTERKENLRAYTNLYRILREATLSVGTTILSYLIRKPEYIKNKEQWQLSLMIQRKKCPRFLELARDQDLKFGWVRATLF
jgi:uncharacterized protein YbaP (TraB family)